MPGLGDALGALIGGYIVLAALRAGAPRLVIVRMLANIGLDAIVGAVPVAGTIFDVAHKANRRNAELLAEWAQHPAAVAGRQRRLALAIAVVLLGLLAIASTALAFGAWAVIRLLG